MVTLKTLKEKYQTYVIIILVAVVFLFMVYKKIKITWVHALILLVAVAVYFVLTRPKVIDIYKIAKTIQLRHYKITGEMLDISSIEATEMPVNSNRLLICFKNDARVFEVRDNMIIGVQTREISSIKNDMERSKIVETVSKQQTMREQLKEGAKKLGIDPASLFGE